MTTVDEGDHPGALGDCVAADCGITGGHVRESHRACNWTGDRLHICASCLNTLWPKQNCRYSRHDIFLFSWLKMTFIQIAYSFASAGPITDDPKSKVPLSHVKLLPEPMKTQFKDLCRHHQTSIFKRPLAVVRETVEITIKRLNLDYIVSLSLCVCLFVCMLPTLR